eukprot:scaffold17299_cov82-Attheya_sp.AAC.2
MTWLKIWGEKSVKLKLGRDVQSRYTVEIYGRDVQSRYTDAAIILTIQLKPNNNLDKVPDDSAGPNLAKRVVDGMGAFWIFMTFDWTDFEALRLSNLQEVQGSFPVNAPAG